MKTMVCVLLTLVWINVCGCTSQLWEDTDQNVLVWIDADEITEAELKKRGVKYEVYTSEKGSGYLVRKSAKQKFVDYNLRLLGAPVTLAVDAAGVVVVGAFTLSTDPDFLECVLYMLQETLNDL